jgi:hypothetical protein
MFGQPFVLNQLGSTVLLGHPAALDAVISVLVLFGLGALAYGGWLLAKAPDHSPRVHLKPEHRRRKRR